MLNYLAIGTYFRLQQLLVTPCKFKIKTTFKLFNV